MIIYKVTNQLDGKVYIGQTCMSLKRRKTVHYERAAAGSETNFHRALRKYTKEVFVWEILTTCLDKKDMNEKEQFYINQYDSFKSGYNMTEGGDGGLTYKKGSELYHKIRHKLGKWKNGNPGATKSAIEKRIDSFVNVNWPKGSSHKNTGHSHNKGKTLGNKNGMFGKFPYLQSVEIDGVIYESLGAAAKVLGVTRATIKGRCKSDKYPTWRLLNVTKQTQFRNPLHLDGEIQA